MALEEGGRQEMEREVKDDRRLGAQRTNAIDSEYIRLC